MKNQFKKPWEERSLISNVSTNQNTSGKKNLSTTVTPVSVTETDICMHVSVKSIWKVISKYNKRTSLRRQSYRSCEVFNLIFVLRRTHVSSLWIFESHRESHRILITSVAQWRRRGLPIPICFSMIFTPMPMIIQYFSTYNYLTKSHLYHNY